MGLRCRAAQLLLGPLFREVLLTATPNAYTQQAAIAESVGLNGVDKHNISEHANHFANVAMHEMEELHNRWVDERDARMDADEALEDQQQEWIEKEHSYKSSIETEILRF